MRLAVGLYTTKSQYITVSPLEQHRVSGDWCAATIKALTEHRRVPHHIQNSIGVGITRGCATSALELGIDIGDLDASLLVGYPGTIASVWQQAGRAGRGTRHALSVLIALDNPLDQYFVRNPGDLFGRPHEHALIDPGNPYVLEQHLPCTAQEIPLSRSAEDTEQRYAAPAAPARAPRRAIPGRGRSGRSGGDWTRWASCTRWSMRRSACCPSLPCANAGTSAGYRRPTTPKRIRRWCSSATRFRVAWASPRKVSTCWETCGAPPTTLAGLPQRGRLPELYPVSEVREQQRAAGQGGGGADLGGAGSA